jgi:type VI secretion system secreted protein VgrG
LPELSTESRTVKINGPVPDTGFMFQKLEAVESLSSPYTINLELMSPKGNLDFKDFGGKEMGVEISTADGHARYFRGYVIEMARVSGQVGESDEQIFTYQIRLAPWAWFLSRRADCRIFNSNDGKSPNSVKDILKKVFTDAGFSSDYDLGGLSETYPSLNYVVQYNETDLDFVSRILEREGIYYYFEHTASSHKMKLADSPSAHTPITNYEKISFKDPRKGSSAENIEEWVHRQAVRTGTFVHRDYDPADPAKNLEKKKTDKGPSAQSEHEWYNYPGQYVEPAEGDRHVKARLAELQFGADVVKGKGNAFGLVPGHTFELEGHVTDSENQKYLVVSSTTVAMATKDSWDPDKNLVKCDTYTVSFSAMPATRRYHPPRFTPVPRAMGAHTAIVVGQKGEEITTDEFGRVKVQFHWDRLGKNDQDSSCWVRVSQAWAHGAWGSQIIPRHGMEVIVEYIDADLEKPIVTGCVYNGKNKPPFELPANATQSGVKSRSSKEGAATNFNEIRLEDKKGEELFFIQAEMNAERIVKNDDKQTIGLETKDKGDQIIEIHNDRTVTLNEGNDKLEIKKGNHDIIVGTGEQTIDVKKTIMIKAGDQITLETGSASIVMKKDGTITIKGKDITIDGSGNITEKASSNIAMKAGGNIEAKPGGNFEAKAGGNFTGSAGGAAKVSGSTGTFDGGGSCTIKGAIVNIN